MLTVTTEPVEILSDTSIKAWGSYTGSYVVIYYRLFGLDAFYSGSWHAVDEHIAGGGAGTPFSHVITVLPLQLYRVRAFVDYKSGRTEYYTYGAFVEFSTGIKTMHFKAYAVGGDGITYYGDDMTFEY